MCFGGLYAAAIENNKCFCGHSHQLTVADVWQFCVGVEKNAPKYRKKYDW